MLEKMKADDSKKAKLPRNQIPADSIESLLELLSEAAYECGADISELAQKLRDVSIRLEVKRQMYAGNRLNVSRISAATGVSREKISSFLRQSRARAKNLRRSNVLNRILNAWHREARYISGRSPIPLKLFGRGATFESLARKYGRGLPTRAILDELLFQQKIKFHSPMFVVPSGFFMQWESLTHKSLEVLASRLARIKDSGIVESRAKPKSFRKRLNFRRI